MKKETGNKITDIVLTSYYFLELICGMGGSAVVVVFTSGIIKITMATAEVSVTLA